MTFMEKKYLRFWSSLLLMAVMLVFIYCQDLFFSFSFLWTIGFFMTVEWSHMIGGNISHFSGWLVGGLFYVGLSLLPLLWVKFARVFGNHLLMWLILLIWSTDIFAYLVGHTLKWGRHHICSISPSKSYEGLVGGMMAAIVFCYLFASFFLPDKKQLLLGITPLLCCLEQAGDFTESYFKRKFGLKDSSQLIPGHGGFLDRFDGFLYVTPVLLWFTR
jgi:phosphatidate cytidylyltransferase